MSFLGNPLLGLMSQGAGVGVSTAAAKQQAEAHNLAMQYNATIARQEADVARQQAENARTYGGIEADARRREYAQLQSSQRLAYAAAGVEVNSGSAALVQADTAAWGEYEAQKEIYNYGVQAWGFEQQSRTREMEAQSYLAQRQDPRLAMATTAISGMTPMFEKFSRWNTGRRNAA